MRQITKTIYNYSELSDAAKAKARQDYAGVHGYSGADEAMRSLTALAAHFGGTIGDYQIDWFNASYSSATFAMPELDADEVRELLESLGTYDPETLKGKGDCKLTGCATDEDAIDGFRKAFHEGERDVGKLMDAAFAALLEACQADCESFYADEDGCFADHCEANEYEFYEDGTAY